MALTRYLNSSGSMNLIQAIGDNFYQLGNYTEAIKYYDKALARSPNSTQIQQQKTLAVMAPMTLGSLNFKPQVTACPRSEDRAR
jgi:tetratricopeptide (TPR) repeat protein